VLVAHNGWGLSLLLLLVLLLLPSCCCTISTQLLRPMVVPLLLLLLLPSCRSTISTQLLRPHAIASANAALWGQPPGKGRPQAGRHGGRGVGGRALGVCTCSMGTAPWHGTAMCLKVHSW